MLKKRIVILGLVMALLMCLSAGLVGCDSNTSKGSEDTKEQPKEQKSVKEETSQEEEPVVETKFPERSISDVVFSSAGGGTDTWNRLICSVMEQKFGEKILVSNMPGGKGGTAAVHVWESPHDGYKWLGASETSTTMGVNGATEHTCKDWEFFIVAGSKGVLCVPDDSPYTTYNEFINAAKETPNEIKIANSGLGKLWHVKAYLTTQKDAVPVKHVPYKGSRPALIACISKEVDAVAASTGEVVEFIKAGKLRPLVMMENEEFDFPGYGKVPGVSEFYPDAKKYFPLNQWLGIMIPSDVPKPILEKIKTTFDECVKSDVIADNAKNNLATVYGLSGKEAKNMALEQEKKMSWLLQEFGLAKVNPEELGIEKP